MFKKYETYSTQKKHAKAKAKLILRGAENKNIEEIVENWNNSLEKSETDRDYDFIYTNAVKQGFISVKNLTKYANYARLNLLLRLVHAFKHFYFKKSIFPLKSCFNN